MKRSDIQQTKSITFKTATIIVVSLHLLGFATLWVWSKHKADIARQIYLSDRERMLNERDSKQSNLNWPSAKNDLKPRVVAVPSPAIRPNKQPIKLTEPKQITKTAKEAEKKIAKAATVTKQVITQTVKPGFEKLQKESDRLINEELKAQFKRIKQQNVPVVSSEIVREQIDQITTHIQTIPMPDSINEIILTPDKVKTFVHNGIHYIEL